MRRRSRDKRAAACWFCQASASLPIGRPSSPSHATPPACTLFLPLLRRGRRADVLWCRARRSASPRSQLCRSHSLPVQTPIKFYQVINLKTAKVLDITIAPSPLATADGVINSYSTTTPIKSSVGTRLRIWGPGVRISSGAPTKSTSLANTLQATKHAALTCRRPTTPQSARNRSRKRAGP
jgi:hypothetical protein